MTHSSDDILRSLATRWRYSLRPREIAGFTWSSDLHEWRNDLGAVSTRGTANL